MMKPGFIYGHKIFQKFLRIGFKHRLKTISYQEKKFEAPNFLPSEIKWVHEASLSNLEKKGKFRSSKIFKRRTKQKKYEDKSYQNPVATGFEAMAFFASTELLPLISPEVGFRLVA